MAQVIQWTNKSKYQFHGECVVLARIEYPDYRSHSLFEQGDLERDYLKESKTKTKKI